MTAVFPGPKLWVTLRFHLSGCPVMRSLSGQADGETEAWGKGSDLPKFLQAGGSELCSVSEPTQKGRRPVTVHFLWGPVFCLFAPRAHLTKSKRGWFRDGHTAHCEATARLSMYASTTSVWHAGNFSSGELPDVQAGFRKGRGTRDQIANIRWIIEKAREFQKNTWFPPLGKMRPLPATASQGKSPVPP